MRDVAVVSFAVLTVPAAAHFVVPGPAGRSAALGKLEGVSPPLRRAFDARGFLPIKPPGLFDWLANFDEPGQRMDQFVGARPNLPDNRRRRIYLMPIGDVDRNGGPGVARLVEFSHAFFGLETATLPMLDLRTARIMKRRLSRIGSEQILTTDVLAILKSRLPDDAYALLGITMVDLYPDEKWNFVFGQASLKDRVGVYSFARYDPAKNGGKREDAERVMLRRSCHILAHETGHMFGIAHCIWCQCVMNGSNNLEEFDTQPLHLCPVDLRKLQWSVGFDAADRYRRLLAFYEKTGLTDEADWVRGRLRLIEGR